MDIGNIFGGKPRIAKYKPVDLQKEQGKSVAGNVSAFPEISKLGDLYSSNELAQLEKILPGYGDQISAGRATTDLLFKQAGQELSGQIPQDVQDQVQRSSAYTALRGGYMGSPMAGALTARDLGLTSLDLIGKGAQLSGQGVNSMQAWDNLARKDMFDPGSMLTTPSQQAAIATQNHLASQQQRQNQFNVDAAPDPVAKGIFDSTMKVIGMVLSVYGGGKGYSPQQADASQQPNFNQGSYSGDYFNANPYAGSSGGGFG